VGNALAMTSELAGPTLIRVLNSLTPEIFFTAASPIPETFRVRSATRRIYRYFEPTPPSRAEGWNVVGQLFSGTVDVRSLGRGLPADRPQWREIESVRTTSLPPGLLVEVRAPSFVWGMVRKIVGALREIDRGHLARGELVEALAGRRRLTLPMAEPEPLVLWDVEYPQKWQYVWDGPNRHQVRWWAQARSVATTRLRVIEAMTPS
jgi:tRNA pseudouridine(38-40) synthase